MSAPTVLVTGCSSGIGLATAVEFARTGASVFATVRGDPDRDDPAPRLRAALEAEALTATIVQLDVADERSRRRCVADVLAACGRVDVLVNNAGIGGRGPVEAIDPRTLQAVFDTNFFGAVALTALVVPGMRAAGSGVIVNVSSIDGRLRGRPLLWPYQASKHALSVMSEGLALEVEPFGVRVRLVEPGFFATRIGANRIAREDAGDPPWRRPGAPYAGTAVTVDAYLGRGAATAADPGVVARAIVAACADPEPFPIRVVVGDDARELDRAYVGTDELDDLTRWHAEQAGEWLDGS